MALYNPFIERNIDKIASAINESQQKKMAEGAYMGDPQAIAQLNAANPQLAQQIQQSKMRDQQMALQKTTMEKQAKDMQRERDRIEAGMPPGTYPKSKGDNDNGKSIAMAA